MQCDVAEDDEVTEIWQTCFLLSTEEEVRTEATQLVEPMVIFKLMIVTVNTPLIVCHPVQCSEDNMLNETIDIDQLEYMSAKEKHSANTYDTVTEVICVDTKTCPENTQKKERESIEMEVRSLVRLYRKPSPSPPRQTMYKKENYLPCPKGRIKFSTSTALYTPAKPCYENYRKTECPRDNPSSARSSLSSSFNILATARARSEFREKSIGKRTKRVSLY